MAIRGNARPLPPIEDLKEMYLDLGSIHEIASALGVDPRRVDAVLVGDGFLDPQPITDLPQGERLVEEYRTIGGLVLLARRYGASQERVRWLLREAGVSEGELQGPNPPRTKLPLEQHKDEILLAHSMGETDSQIAARYGASRHQVRYVRYKHSGPTWRRLTQGEREQAERLLADGEMTASEVGRRLGIGPASARRYRPSELNEPVDE